MNQYPDEFFEVHDPETGESLTAAAFDATDARIRAWQAWHAGRSPSTPAEEAQFANLTVTHLPEPEGEPK